MDVGVMGGLYAGVPQQTRGFFQRNLLAANPESGSRVAEHVWREADSRPFGKPFHKGHDRLVGHGTPNFAFPQIHKHKIWKRINFQRSQILDEVIDVELHDLGQRRNGIGISGLRTRTIWIVITRDNLERTIFYTEVFPEELEVVGSGSDRIRTPAQVIEKHQVRANGLNRDKLIVKYQPTNLISVGRAYSLYLHDLHSFHQKNDTDMCFLEE